MGNVPKDEERKAPGGGHAAGGAAASPRTERAGPSEDERGLIRRAQSGDVAAYEELVQKHQQRVFAVVSGVLRRREDIEDVVQQVLLKVFVSLRQFDLRSTFSTWLYKIAVNECYDYLRKKRVRRLVYESDLSEDQIRQIEAFESGSTAHAPPADAARRAELRQVVGRLLEELGEEDRLMLILKEVEGFSVEEISEVLDVNVNTVKVRLFRARAKLTAVYRKRLRERRR